MVNAVAEATLQTKSSMVNVTHSRRNTNRKSMAGREEISEPSLGIGRVQCAGHAQKSPASLASQAKNTLNRKNRKIVFQKLALLRLSG